MNQGSVIDVDRRKAAIYTNAAYRTYWIIDVETRRLEVYEEPMADGVYKLARRLEANESVKLPESDVVLAVAELLPEEA